jgi:hypothetical protein
MGKKAAHCCFCLTPLSSEAAMWLAERIAASPEAQDQGLTVWIDKHHLGAGLWKDQFQKALKESTAFAAYVGTKGGVNWAWDKVSVALASSMLAKGADKAALRCRFPERRKI